MCRTEPVGAGQKHSNGRMLEGAGRCRPVAVVQRRIFRWVLKRNSSCLQFDGRPAKAEKQSGDASSLISQRQASVFRRCRQPCALQCFRTASPTRQHTTARLTPGRPRCHVDQHLVDHRDHLPLGGMGVVSGREASSLASPTHADRSAAIAWLPALRWTAIRRGSRFAWRRRAPLPGRWHRSLEREGHC